MNDELKAKLGKILTDFAGQVYLAASEHQCYPSEQPFITEIHQAYEDMGYITKRKPVNHIFDCLYCGKHNERRLAPSQVEAGYNPKYCDQACRRAHTLALRESNLRIGKLEEDDDE